LGDYRVAHTYPGFLDFFPGAGSDIDEHLLLLHDLVACLTVQEMWRAGADDTYDVTLMRFDNYAVAQENLVPPASQLHKFEETVLGDETHHEAYLVQVSGEHHPWALSLLPADEASQFILRDCPYFFQVFSQQLPYFILVARNAVRFGKCF
jgi:hypothetical protein